MVAVPRLSLGSEEKKGDQALFERCPVATAQKCSSFCTSYGVSFVIKMSNQAKTQPLGIKGDYLSRVGVFFFFNSFVLRNTLEYTSEYTKRDLTHEGMHSWFWG